MSGRPTLSPDLKFFSRTRPVIKLLYRVRTNAEPLPGFTCWNSTMTYGSLSIRILSPLRNSLVSITSAIAAVSLLSTRGRAVYRKHAQSSRPTKGLKATSLVVDVDVIVDGDGDVAVGAVVKAAPPASAPPPAIRTGPGPRSLPAPARARRSNRASAAGLQPRAFPSGSRPRLPF